MSYFKLTTQLCFLIAIHSVVIKQVMPQENVMYRVDPDGSIDFSVVYDEDTPKEDNELGTDDHSNIAEDILSGDNDENKSQSEGDITTKSSNPSDSTIHNGEDISTSRGIKTNEASEDEDNSDSDDELTTKSPLSSNSTTKNIVKDMSTDNGIEQKEGSENKEKFNSNDGITTNSPNSSNSDSTKKSSDEHMPNSNVMNIEEEVQGQNNDNSKHDTKSPCSTTKVNGGQMPTSNGMETKEENENTTKSPCLSNSGSTTKSKGEQMTPSNGIGPKENEMENSFASNNDIRMKSPCSQKFDAKMKHSSESHGIDSNEDGDKFYSGDDKTIKSPKS